MPFYLQVISHTEYIRNGVSTRPEDPRLSREIDAFALAANVSREKFLADLRDYTEDRFRGEYPLVASAPTTVAQLRNYAKEGGK